MKWKQLLQKYFLDTILGLFAVFLLDNSGGFWPEVLKNCVA